MIPVDQTVFGHPSGNCLMACVASILECSLDTLPDLGDDHTGAWWDPFVQSVRRGGYEPIYWYENANLLRPPGYHIAAGVSPRSLNHAVVALDGTVIHDPHPSRDGITSIKHWYLFIPKTENV